MLEKDPSKLDVPHLATFILKLHDRGIQFRTIHFGNIIQLDDKSNGLNVW